jgi:hypothetical protein
MKKYMLGAATAALVTMSPILSSCSTVLPIVGALTNIGGSGGVQCKVPLSVAKAYFIEEASYRGVLLALNEFADNGTLVKGSPASIRAKAYLEKAIPVHAAVHTAVNACNSSQLATQVQAAQDVIADLQLLLGEAKANSGS